MKKLANTLICALFLLFSSAHAENIHSVKKFGINQESKSESQFCDALKKLIELNEEEAKSSIKLSSRFLNKHYLYYNAYNKYITISFRQTSFSEDKLTFSTLKKMLVECNQLEIKSEEAAKVYLEHPNRQLILESLSANSFRLRIYLDKVPSNHAKNCVSGDCRNGYGRVTYSNGNSYEGTFKNGLMDGQGTYFYQNGTKIIGVFKNNIANGECKQYNAMGKLAYEGNYYGGKLNGFGKAYDKNTGKLIYEGNWKKGKKDGKGTEYFLNGSYYTGDFKDGIIEGQGTTTWPSGDRYVGNFKDGKRSGQGTYNFASGAKHVGENLNGKFNGIGKEYSKNGKLLYEGNYRNGKLDGFGTKYYTDGKYVGMWKEGKRAGDGKFYNIEGKLAYDGLWKDDKSVNKWSLSTKASSTGCVKGNCNNGWGKYIYDNGSYEGFFMNNSKNGYGTYLWNNGDQYFGNWRNNIRHGFGQYIWKNNTKYEGEWTNGKITGYGEKKELNNKYSYGYWVNGTLKNKYAFFINKNVSVGCIAGNCQNGYGKYKWSNGDIFQGFFVNGKRRLGRYTYPSGNVYFGEFSLNGSFDGNAFYFWKDKSYYAGQYKNNNRDGLGYYKNANTKNEQIGEWKNGELSKSYK